MSRSGGWVTFWTAISALATVAGVVVAVVLANRQPGGAPPDTASTAAVITIEPTSEPTSESTTEPTRIRQSTTENPSADRPRLTAAESALVGRLSPTLFSSCEPERSEEANGVVAAVSCDASGPTRRPLILQFANSDAASAWIDNEQQGITDDGTCAGGNESIGDWRNSRGVQGRIACTWKNRPLYRICWTYDDDLLGLVAEGTDAEVLVSWWKKASVPL